MYPSKRWLNSSCTWPPVMSMRCPGRQIDMFDDLDELLDRSQEIEELDLNVSRVRLLDGRAPGQP